MPDSVLIAIARNTPKYEAKEKMDALVLELANRLQVMIERDNGKRYDARIAEFGNFLLRD